MLREVEKLTADIESLRNLARESKNADLISQITEFGSLLEGFYKRFSTEKNAEAFADLENTQSQIGTIKRMFGHEQQRKAIIVITRIFDNLSKFGQKQLSLSSESKFSDLAAADVVPAIATLATAAVSESAALATLDLAVDAVPASTALATDPVADSVLAAAVSASTTLATADSAVDAAPASTVLATLDLAVDAVPASTALATSDSAVDAVPASTAPAGAAVPTSAVLATAAVPAAATADSKDDLEGADLHACIVKRARDEAHKIKDSIINAYKIETGTTDENRAENYYFCFFERIRQAENKFPSLPSYKRTSKVSDKERKKPLPKPGFSSRS